MAKIKTFINFSVSYKIIFEMRVIQLIVMMSLIYLMNEDLDLPTFLFCFCYSYVQIANSKSSRLIFKDTIWKILCVKEDIRKLVAFSILDIRVAFLTYCFFTGTLNNIMGLILQGLSCILSR